LTTGGVRYSTQEYAQRSRGLSDRQNALIRAWCALYAVLPLLDMAAAQAARIVMSELRSMMTPEASHRCALWEGRYWRQQHGEAEHG